MPSYEQIGKLTPRYLRDEYIGDVRCQGGDRLFISAGCSNLVVIDPKSNRAMCAPGRWSFVSTNGEFLVWFDDAKNGVTFQDGTTIRVSATERFGVSQNSEYYYLYSPSNGSRLYRTRAPQNALIVLAADALPYRLLAIGSTLYVCVVMITSDRDQRIYEDKCFLVNCTTEEGHLDGVVMLPGAVVDIAPDGRWFLLDNRSDLFARWFVYDVRSKKKHYVGLRQAYGFWVNEELAIEVLRGTAVAHPESAD